MSFKSELSWTTGHFTLTCPYIQKGFSLSISIHIYTVQYSYWILASYKCAFGIVYGSFQHTFIKLMPLSFSFTVQAFLYRWSCVPHLSDLYHNCTVLSSLRLESKILLEHMASPIPSPLSHDSAAVLPFPVVIQQSFSVSDGIREPLQRMPSLSFAEMQFTGLHRLYSNDALSRTDSHGCQFPCLADNWAVRRLSTIYKDWPFFWNCCALTVRIKTPLNFEGSYFIAA